MSEVEVFRSAPLAIEPEWIDYNGHLNMAYYNVIFDRGGDEFLTRLGFGPDYARDRKLTIYTAEIHVCYLQELHLNDTVTVTSQLLDYDSKRLHTYIEIIHQDGWVAATAEVMNLHVDMSGPKVSSFPDDILPTLELVKLEHSKLPKPSRAGRSIGIGKR